MSLLVLIRSRVCAKARSGRASLLFCVFSGCHSGPRAYFGFSRDFQGLVFDRPCEAFSRTRGGKSVSSAEEPFCVEGGALFGLPLALTRTCCFPHFCSCFLFLSFFLCLSHSYGDVAGLSEADCLHCFPHSAGSRDGRVKSFAKSMQAF